MKAVRFPTIDMMLLLVLSLCGMNRAVAAEPLQVSVYCTAGDVLACMRTAVDREEVLRAIAPLKVSRLFLEGRRGDLYVPPERLAELRDFFSRSGIHCSGGIATVPGANFGVRQQGGLDWLNWESPRTRTGVATYFSENAPVFPELIVDDFFCTGDESAESAVAKGARSWGEYRRDLLVSLMGPCMFRPAANASKQTHLIIKFPQWYDLFHLYGYDPPRMIERFSEVWVGTEVRNPHTRRMGFVQPTEGYVNFRWLASQGGSKVRGAWFDHIECDAQQFVDQAYGSVLAGAQELTLFSLADVGRKHPGDGLLAARLPDLRKLAKQVRDKPSRGIAFYKPPGSDGEENVNLADYLAMIGLPVVPVASYPAEGKVAFLPVQAAADPQLIDKVQQHLMHGATVVFTPALVRAIGSRAVKLAGIDPGLVSVPMQTRQVSESGLGNGGVKAPGWILEVPLEIDGGARSVDCESELVAFTDRGEVPFLVSRRVGRGRVLLVNLRTFSQRDFVETQEYLLAPKPLGITKIPQSLADRIRAPLLAPFGVRFKAPPGVQLVLLGKSKCLYSFRDVSTPIQLEGKRMELAPHSWVWR